MYMKYPDGQILRDTAVGGGQGLGEGNRGGVSF